MYRKKNSSGTDLINNFKENIQQYIFENFVTQYFYGNTQPQYKSQ